MLILTGASDNHYSSLLNFIDSFLLYCIKPLKLHKLIVYNLGLTKENWQNLQLKYKEYNSSIKYKIFDYSKYPEWFNINIEAGQYAWKPTIIYNEYLKNKNSIILWMDSGNLITDNLMNLQKFLLDNGVFSGISSGNIETWTYPDTINYLKCTWTDKENRNGACIGFNIKKKFAKDLLVEFYNYSQIKECIAPEGSNRSNHRQDQAVFTILFYKYMMKYNFNQYNNTHSKIHLGYSIHNDIDSIVQK
uniref:Uncharacterized protein n=1 Tax=viral metagenome TaxID=1070528 RepID=A0A6C0HZJ8_9ZZZZ